MTDVINNMPTVFWRYLPYSDVGGDLFGYKWLDESHLTLYLIDVAGHGIQAAHYCARIRDRLNTLQASKDPVLYDPAKVLEQFNHNYPMLQNNNLFFTLWYGVYKRENRVLMYASAGSPPGVLMPHATLLSTHGAVIGVAADSIFEAASCSIPEKSTLYLMSDGVYELLKRDGTMGNFDEFLNVLREGRDLDELVAYAKAVSGKGGLQDDFCLAKIQF